jgi:hypothetical protein
VPTGGARHPTALERDIARNPINPSEGNVQVRKLLFLFAGLAVFLVVWPATAVAAAPEKAMFRDTFPDNICGFDGISTIKVVDLFTAFPNNTFRDSSEFQQTFVADNGKSLSLRAAGLTRGQIDPTVNPDGTITFTTTFIGMPEQVKITNGPLLSLDAGAVTITRTFTVDQNGNIVDLVSQQLSGLHGPHPDLLSDFSLFCDEIGAYLADP